eukprot:9858464-Lingulodinium_polyedra.AAC.1
MPTNTGLNFWRGNAGTFSKDHKPKPAPFDFLMRVPVCRGPSAPPCLPAMMKSWHGGVAT